MNAATGVGTESKQMAKVQKSLLINEDLVRLLDAHAKLTGASFTRQVTAAVLQYLFSDPSGPNRSWMEFAVELDSGELNIAEKTPFVAGYDKDAGTIAAEHDSLIELQQKLHSGLLTIKVTKVAPDGKVPEIFEDPAEREAFERWQRLLDYVARFKDPISGIAEYWRTQSPS
jgi:hypothetical protein